MRGRRGGFAIGGALVAAVAIVVGIGATGRLAWAATAGFSVPRVDGHAGGEVVVPVRAQATTETSAMQGALSYDAAVLQVVDVTAGAGLPPGARADFNADQPGFLRMGFVCSPSKGHFRGEGAVLSVRFRVLGHVGQSTDLTLSLVRAWEPNDAESLVTTASGSVRVVESAPMMGVPLRWVVVGLGAFLLLVLLWLLRRKRPERAAPRPAAPAASRAAGNAPGTRFCTSCGTPTQADQRFCGSCGAALAGAPRS